MKATGTNVTRHEITGIKNLDDALHAARMDARAKNRTMWVAGAWDECTDGTTYITQTRRPMMDNRGCWKVCASGTVDAMPSDFLQFHTGDPGAPIRIFPVRGGTHQRVMVTQNFHRAVNIARAIVQATGRSLHLVASPRGCGMPDVYCSVVRHPGSDRAYWTFKFNGTVANYGGAKSLSELGV